MKLGEKPQGRFTQNLKAKSDDKGDDAEDVIDVPPSKPDDKSASEERAEADEADVDLAAKLTDPDVLHIYGKAAEQAWERLIQQGHLPPNSKPVINEAMVQEVQNLVRDAQQRGAM